jgi:hypothetical protein
MNDQITSLSKTELLQQIQSERKSLEKTLSTLTPAQMLLPGVDGEWNVKDVLAHISAWERRMNSWIGSHIAGRMPEVPLPWDVDRMNLITYNQVNDRSLSEVLEEFQQSFGDSLALVASLSEVQLQVTYPDTWPMGPLWTGVAANMNWHYKEHRSDILKWLESN